MWVSMLLCSKAAGNDCVDLTRGFFFKRRRAYELRISDWSSDVCSSDLSFVAHLRVLEGSGLVRSKKTGRVRTYQLVPKRLKLAEDWLGRQRALWERRDRKSTRLNSSH